MSLIECKHLKVGYENRTAVDDVSFSINEGDYLCIVGENGSGKSTLMKSILGLIPIKSGEIIFNGLKQNQIGYLPQQTIVQRDFPASVFEVVLSGCLNRLGMKPFFTAKERKIAEDNIKLLNIEKIRKKAYCDLSGGQQQRVLLARALCATEKILLLDEPFTALDTVVSNELYGVIKMLNKERGITVVMISHDVRNSVESSDMVLHMDTKILFYGTSAEYLKSQASKRLLGEGGENDTDNK
jgi:zinc transport system ATP-binding protein